MERPLPVARPGDVCILVEPDVEEIPHLRHLQGELQISFGGRPQQRVHFTCQRFALPSASDLPQVVDQLRKNLSTVPPLTVRAGRLELVEHPFWEFCVLRWDLHLSPAMYNLAGRVEAALDTLGLPPHYPSGPGWRPHVTALEAIPTSNGYHPNGHHKGQILYRARRITLSQLQEGKRFEILAEVKLRGEAVVV